MNDIVVAAGKVDAIASEFSLEMFSDGIVMYGVIMAIV